jgi:hypothetical protein
VQVILSFGSQSGRTRSGTKGFSSKEKKLKRKKQEFHTHKRWHDQDAERPDPEEVRARTMLALDRLGHQVISTEPGGYDLEDWLRSLNSLLDDFQERIGPDRVSEEFRARRQEAVEVLMSRSKPGGANPEIERLIHEEGEARKTLDEAQEKAAARLASLREERDSLERELKAERQRLAELREAKQSRTLFSRMLRAGPSTEEAEASVAKLGSDLRRTEEEIERARKTRSAAAGPAGQEGNSTVFEAQQRLEAVRRELMDLQSAVQSSLQLASERELATQKISGAISSMKLDGASSEGGAR